MLPLGLKSSRLPPLLALTSLPWLPPPVAALTIVACHCLMTALLIFPVICEIPECKAQGCLGHHYVPGISPQGSGTQLVLHKCTII